jgi:predicted metalloprotease
MILATIARSMLSRGARLGLVAAAVAAIASVVVAVRRADHAATVARPGPGASDARVTARASELVDDAQATWAELLRRGGRSYSEARLVPFRGAVRSECGWDERAVAPFYCAADERVYLDLDVATGLLARGEPGGSRALGYVVAHAIGHHVQALTGVERRVRREQQADPAREEELARALELQADCFAGVWARASDRSDLSEATAAATLELVAQVVSSRPRAVEHGPPEAWLHASADARLAWLLRGLASGDPDACDPLTEPPRP